MYKSGDNAVAALMGRQRITDEVSIDIPLTMALVPGKIPHSLEVDHNKLRVLGRNYMHVLGGFGGTSSTDWPNQSPKIDHRVQLRLIPSVEQSQSDDFLLEARFLGRREDRIEGPHERVFVLSFGFGMDESPSVSAFVRGMLEAMAIQAERLKSPCSAFEHNKSRRTIELNVFSPTDLLGVQSLLS